MPFVKISRIRLAHLEFIENNLNSIIAAAIIKSDNVEIGKDVNQRNTITSEEILEIISDLQSKSCSGSPTHSPNKNTIDDSLLTGDGFKITDISSTNIENSHT